MKRTFIGLIVFAGFFFQLSAIACTMVRTSVSGVDPNRYVLYGTVIGYGQIVSAHCKNALPTEDYCNPIKTLIVKPDRILHAPVQIAGDIQVMNTFVGDELCGIAFNDHDNLLDYSPGMRLKVSAPSVSEWYSSSEEDGVVLDGGFQGDIAALHGEIDDDLNQRKLCKLIEEVDANGAYGAELTFEEQKLYLELEGESSDIRRYELLKNFIGCAGGLNFFSLRRLEAFRSSLEWPGDVVKKYLHSTALQRKLKADLYIHYYFLGRLSGYSDEEAKPFLREMAMQGDRRFQYEFSLGFERTDQSQYLKWLKKSADQRYLPAMHALASFYSDNTSERGQLDADQVMRRRADDLLKRTMELAQKQAEQDDPVALSILAVIYFAESETNPDMFSLASSYSCRLTKWMDDADSWIYNSSNFDMRSIVSWCNSH